MNEYEHIKVYVRYDEFSRTVCICPRWDKKCEEHCTPDVVTRNKFRGIYDLCKVDKYGKSKERDD